MPCFRGRTEPRHPQGQPGCAGPRIRSRGRQCHPRKHPRIPAPGSAVTAGTASPASAPHPGDAALLPYLLLRPGQLLLHVAGDFAGRDPLAAQLGHLACCFCRAASGGAREGGESRRAGDGPGRHRRLLKGHCCCLTRTATGAGDGRLPPPCLPRIPDEPSGVGKSGKHRKGSALGGAMSLLSSFITQ